VSPAKTWIRPAPVAVALAVFAAAVLAGAGCDDEAAGPMWSMHISPRRQPWDTPRADGVLLRTRHYRIYSTADNRMLVTYLPGFMEASRQNYLRITGLPPEPTPEGLPIYLMGSRDEWAALTREVVGPQRADAYLQISAGGYCYKKTCFFWDIGGLGTFAVAAHEGLHQYLKYRLDDQLPMWLEEGLCVTAEGYEIDGDRVRFTPGRNVHRWSNLRNAIVQGYWIPTDKLLAMDAGHAVGTGEADRAVGYYGQLWALVRFLRSEEPYRRGLQRLLADAEAGRLHAALGVSRQDLARLRRHGRRYNKAISTRVFRRYITDDLDAFERAYRAFARRLVDLEPQAARSPRPSRG